MVTTGARAVKRAFHSHLHFDTGYWTSPDMYEALEPAEYTMAANIDIGIFERQLA